MNVKTLEYHDINRFHIISDTHFGVRSNSIEWIEIQYDFFEKFYIPYLKKIVKPGDAIIHLGDVFESRQFVNVRVMNMAIDIMKKLAEIMPVFIICGNHDIYYKSTNDINSIKIFELLALSYFPRQCVLSASGPDNQYIHNRSIFMMQR